MLREDVECLSLDEVDYVCAKSVLVKTHILRGFVYYSTPDISPIQPCSCTRVSSHTDHCPHQTLLRCSYILPMSITVNRHLYVPRVYWSG